MSYAPNSLKRDPVSKAIAIRTQFPEDGPLANMAWLVATSNAGARNASTAELAGWNDIEIQEAPTGSEG